MKIGKKIKILRNNLGITGKELSEITGINHGLIRKYETTDCTPQYSYILKIANALNVRPYVLLDKDYEYKSETFGDLYSIIIFLYNSKLIKFNKVNNNINIELNPCIVQFIDINISINETLKENETYPLFLAYIEMCCNLDSFINSLSDLNNPVAIKAINELKDQIEILELKLQQSTLLIK